MAELQGVQLGKIGQIAINVEDIDRATDFYRNVLGMKYIFSAGKLSFFDCDGIRLMLTIPDEERFKHPSSILYFKVDDIGAVYELLLARSVGFEGKPHMIARMPDHDLWMAFFRDSENNVLALMSEVKRQA